ncbi:MAG: DNA recombination protein RmuC [Psychrobium sp.]|nr:DNA recombination protein RmuC [Psychrobium sp.]
MPYTAQEIVTILPAIAISLLLGFFACYLVLRSQQQKIIKQQQTLFDAKSKQAEQQQNFSDDQLDKLHIELETSQQKTHALQEEKLQLYANVRELEAIKQQMSSSHRDQLALINASHEAIKNQFSHLAQQTLEQKSALFAQQNQSSIAALLTPLQSQLADFKLQVLHSHESETKQRHQLQHEIQNLQRLNQQMAQDAVNLTKALKGDNKQQGNWGELILERILQESGLRDGHEYHTQSQHKNEHGKAFRPDVIVHLPDDKDIIIDSKVSLTSYERYFNCETGDQQQLALRDLVNSIRQHIKDLGSKDYQQLQGLRSLDYVLLFIPIEPAFLLAIEHQPNLISEAMAQNIMLVSPTNLLVALRTIHNLWRYDQQNKNAQLIANKASKLYDKLRLFSEDMLGIGHSLNKAQLSYDNALKKLSSGKGNLISQVESFRELGVDVKKELPPHLLEPKDVDNKEIEQKKIEQNDALYP